jgi:hypothetical protein
MALVFELFASKADIRFILSWKKDTFVAIPKKRLNVERDAQVGSDDRRQK